MGMLRRLKQLRQLKKTFDYLNDWMITTRIQQSASPESEYPPVAKPDAIAALAMPTGNLEIDEIHAALIDLLQNDLIRTVKDDAGELRFAVTDAGHAKIREILGGF
jgi:hypothetical protein